MLYSREKHEFNEEDDMAAKNDAYYSREALTERATALLPRLRERQVATNRARQMAPETIKDFWDSDIWYLLKPKKFGGPEVRVDTVFGLASVLAKGDGSAAWIWTVMGVHDLFMAYFEEKAQQEYWANDRTLSASSFAPSGRVAPVPGGYKLSGKWSFCSGIDHAQWMLLAAIAGMLSQDPPIPDIRYFLVPKSDVKVIDDWHVLGLSGTGSKSCTAEDVFVPDYRMVKNSDFLAGTTPGTKIHPAPLYKTPVWAIFPFCISSPAPGIAQGAVEAFIDEMKARASKFDHSPLGRKATVQVRLAEASALADAADLLYTRSLKETIDKGMAGEPLSLEFRIRSRRDQGYSVQLARRATELLLGAQGGGGIFEQGPVQRALRDLTALSGHIVAGWDMPATNYGQVMLGGPPSDPFF
jgi:3-hydroxy-9,10-secoandrosta-1,3,5(10)-triene-9,17-dione monooxygenase